MILALTRRDVTGSDRLSPAANHHRAFTKKQRDDFCAASPRIEPPAYPPLPPATGTRFAPILFGSPPAFLTATCTSFRNGWDREIAARIDPGPAATNASRPHMKIVALILRHELTILIVCGWRKSRDRSIA